MALNHRNLPVVENGQRLYARARARIPGATQLFGKRAELYLPEHWPAYYSKAKGCRIWDLDGNEYRDFTMCGIGACVLGYADSDVNAAVAAALESGNMTTLNCPEEVELADLLCELHPWAEMVRYARTGGEIMAMAVRVARASTGRDEVAFCGYHGWHDWYLAVNLASSDALRGHLLPGLDPAGVPAGLEGNTHPFAYNNLQDLETIVSERGHKLAAIILEPVRNEGPAPGFLEGVRRLATKCGAVLIMDEITSGWRMATSGMHMLYGIEPDLATFAKTISNGIPMAALIGRRSVMDAVQSTFISSAYWTERLGPVAALTTLRKHLRLNAGKHLSHIGELVQQGWRAAADAHGLDISVQGIPPTTNFVFNNEESLASQTLFNQEMLRRSFLASDRFYATMAHTEQDVAPYLQAVDETFACIAHGLAERSLLSCLEGPVKMSGFKRLN
jgi:glutamate-1-semialdehyde 2,1-aminomutase